MIYMDQRREENKDQLQGRGERGVNVQRIQVSQGKTQRFRCRVVR